MLLLNRSRIRVSIVRARPWLHSKGEQMKSCHISEHKRHKEKTTSIVMFSCLIAFLLTFVPSLASATESFETWQSELRVEALSKGISSGVFDTAFVGVQPIERVIELDRSQPEFTMTLIHIYRKLFLERGQKSQTKMAEHKVILAEISEKFKVQPRFIVALWGIETNFGEHTGGFSVIAALATLAYDGRRSTYFRGELLNALQIIEEGHISSKNMKGSWAGAMGQSQFMPSSF